MSVSLPPLTQAMDHILQGHSIRLNSNWPSFEQVKNRTERLNTIFEKATALFTKACQTEEICTHFDSLQILQEKSSKVYSLYCQKTQSFLRRILKAVETLFSFFGAQQVIAQAEASTHEAYRKFQEVLNSQVNLAKNHRNHLNSLKQELTTLSQSATSFFQAKKLIRSCVEHLKALTLLHPHFSARDHLKNFSFDQKLLSALTSSDFDPQDEKSLKAVIQNYLPHIQAPSYNLNSILQFALVKRLNETFIVNEKDWRTYKGAAWVKGCNLNTFEQYISLLNSCSPSYLIIDLKETPCTAELLKELLSLHQVVQKRNTTCEIVLNEIETLDLRGLTIEEEYLFVKTLLTISAPQLNSLKLSQACINRLNENDIHNLLAQHPFPLLLHEICLYGSPSILKGVKWPAALTNQHAFDFSGCSEAAIHNFIESCPRIHSLDLKGSTVTDQALKNWTHLVSLQSLNILNIEECSQLSVDCLPALIKLPSLITLHVSPNLKLGNLNPKDLPKLRDPIKVARFYTTAKVLRASVFNLYEGHSLWASAFQIPLARQEKATPTGLLQVMHQEVVDSTSLALWLYKNDIDHLGQQESVKQLFADENPLITDDNLISILGKFPNLTHLSLYHCPQITDKGIQALINYLPQSKIKTVDLTDCTSVSEKCFFNSSNIDKLKSLEILILSGTNILPIFVQTLQENGINKKIIYTQRNFTVTDGDLLEYGSLEKCLDALHKNPKSIVRLNLQDCTLLKDTDLSDLFDRTCLEDDHARRINIAELNLNGCSSITDQAFLEETIPKPTGLLKTIFVKGTSITKHLAAACPKLAFRQEEYSDPLKPLDIQDSYKRTLGYYIIQPNTSNLVPPHFIQDRIALALFNEELGVKNGLNGLTLKPFNLSSKDFCDSQMNFMLFSYDTAEMSTINLLTHLDIIYYYSSVLRKDLRMGGKFYCALDRVISIADPSAYENAVKLFMQYLYGTVNSSKLPNDFKTLFHTACLILTYNLTCSKRELIQKVMQLAQRLSLEEQILCRTKLDSISENIINNSY